MACGPAGKACPRLVDLGEALRVPTLAGGVGRGCGCWHWQAEREHAARGVHGCWREHRRTRGCERGDATRPGMGKAGAPAWVLVEGEHVGEMETGVLGLGARGPRHHSMARRDEGADRARRRVIPGAGGRIIRRALVVEPVE